MGQFSWSRFVFRSSLFKWFRDVMLVAAALVVVAAIWQGFYMLFENKYLPTLGCAKTAPQCSDRVDIHGSIAIYLIAIALAVVILIGICVGL